MIRPLTKCNQDDEQVYARPASIQNWLERLDGIPKPTRTDQLETGVTELDEKIPPEALVYFASAAWREKDLATFKRIFQALYCALHQLAPFSIARKRVSAAFWDTSFNLTKSFVISTSTTVLRRSSGMRLNNLSRLEI